MTSATIPDKFVFLDTETTGLDFLDKRTASILEIAYAVGDGPVETIRVPRHLVSWSTASPGAIKVNHWFEREFELISSSDYWQPRGVFLSDDPEWVGVPYVECTEFTSAVIAYEELESIKFSRKMRELVNALDGATVVGAAPSFDTSALTSFFQGLYFFNHSHRLWDVQAYAAGKYGWEEFKSFHSIVELLDPDYSVIHKPDHTAAGDVEATRDLFRVLTGRQRD